MISPKLPQTYPFEDDPHIAKVTIAPAEADRLLADYGFELQRQIRPYHVQFLAHLMRHERFRPYTAIDLAWSQPGWKIVNGNHTLAAISQSGLPQPLVIMYRHPADDGALASLYATFDRQLVRRPADMLKAYGFPARYNLTRGQTDGLMAATKFVLSGFTLAGARAQAQSIYLYDQEILYSCACDWAEEALRYFGDIHGAQRPVMAALLRGPVLAVALVTYRFRPKQAQAFWHDVSHDVLVETNDPPKTLLHWLLSTTLKLSPGPLPYAYSVAGAWNAYARGRQLRQIRAGDLSKPILIEGTPHHLDGVYRYVDADFRVVHDPVRMPTPPPPRAAAVALVS